jgi:hypothetical protein
VEEGYLRNRLISIQGSIRSTASGHGWNSHRRGAGCRDPPGVAPPIEAEGVRGFSLHVLRTTGATCLPAEGEDEMAINIFLGAPYDIYRLLGVTRRRLYTRFWSKSRYVLENGALLEGFRKSSNTTRITQFSNPLSGIEP